MAGMPWWEELPKEASAWAIVFISGVHSPKGRTSPGAQKERMKAPEGRCSTGEGCTQGIGSGTSLFTQQCSLTPVCWECGPHSVMPLLESVW